MNHCTHTKELFFLLKILIAIMIHTDSFLGCNIEFCFDVFRFSLTKGLLFLMLIYFSYNSMLLECINISK